MDASVDAQLEIPQHLPTQENSVEIWFSKSILATLCIVPSFIAVPFMKFRFGVDPLVFLAWYFGATSISIVVYLLICGRSEEILPPASARNHYHNWRNIRRACQWFFISGDWPCS